MKKISYSEYHRDRDYLENENLFKNIFRKRFVIINKFVNKKGKVLDIGSSIGIMLDIFKEDGWETWGVDPSESSIEAKKRGHKIIRNYFEKTDLPENFFDLVILNHTLEHLENPLGILKKVYSILKKGGIVLVDVPNFGGLSSKILKSKWPFLVPNEHINQFTKESLARIMKEAGFKILHLESRSGLFEYANPLLELWQALITLKKRFFKDLIIFPYSLIATLLNKGDSMSVIGKKN